MGSALDVDTGAGECSPRCRSLPHGCAPSRGGRSSSSGRSPTSRRGRDPRLEAAEAEHHGLEIVNLQTARCRMEFFDVGAVVWILRRCVWWVPDFSVERYHDALARIR
ncbi:MAG: hypothetical protein U0Q10_06460 [Dermatophilaceae bacterium]